MRYAPNLTDIVACLAIMFVGVRATAVGSERASSAMVVPSANIKGCLKVIGAMLLLYKVYISSIGGSTANPHPSDHWYRMLTATNSTDPAHSVESPAVPAAATAGYTFGWMVDAVVSAVCFWIVHIVWRFLETIADVCFGGMDIARERWGRSGRLAAAHRAEPLRGSHSS
jgi:hypothetical protein